MAQLLVVDDEPTICWGLRKLAEGLGHAVATAASAEQALELVREKKPDAIMIDVRLPGMDGLAAMQHLRAVVGPVPIIVMTAYGDLGTAVEAVRNGAFEYLVKPFELQVAQRVLERAIASEPAAVAERGGPTAADFAGQLVGQSAAMQEVFKRIALVAPSTACVYLSGESGTGKELVARAIHRYSQRSQGPFVAVNVAALSPTIAESELFGHSRGAFTGAEHQRRGLLEQAHGGTIFLDEVADIPLGLQVKLLRALEHGEILPVGADRPVHADFRVVSATHQDLSNQVSAGTFRHDLFFRLSTFQIHLPPLRERPEDIHELAEHFLDLLARKNKLGRPIISPAARAELERRPWYGNVRELRNAIEHAMILSRGGPLEPDHFPAPARATSSPDADDASTIQSLLERWTASELRGDPECTDLYDRMLRLVEPPVLKIALERYQRQCATAARYLGMHRVTLKKKVDQYGIGGQA